MSDMLCISRVQILLTVILSNLSQKGTVDSGIGLPDLHWQSCFTPITIGLGSYTLAAPYSVLR